MNLRGIANASTSTINPNIPVVWLQSTGYTTNAAGVRVPTQNTFNIMAQVQAVTGSNLRHLDAIQQQGVVRSVYMYGNPQGSVRVDNKGGDILQFPQVPGSTEINNWKVIQVVETFPDWGHVIVALQVTIAGG